ncbi:MAG TPA: cysteine hydrolase [Gaiellaceae bacterium]|nr:cysteine hydrolase [Gaiellaceae bacterium]
MSTAVVAVHFQNDVLHPDGKIRAGVDGDDRRRAVLIRNARRLLAGARAEGVPVVSARIAFRPGYRGHVASSPMLAAVVEQGALVDGTWGAEFHQQLRPRRDELVVTHSRINAFYGSDLEQVLASLAVGRLVLAGVATHSAVEHTARHAADMGYEVLVAADACSAADPELHAAALRSLALHVSRVATVDEILGELSRHRG